MILAFIEGLGIVINRMMSDQYKPVMPQLPDDPLGPAGQPAGSSQRKTNLFCAWHVSPALTVSPSPTQVTINRFFSPIPYLNIS